MNLFFFTCIISRTFSYWSDHKLRFWE